MDTFSVSWHVQYRLLEAVEQLIYALFNFELRCSLFGLEVIGLAHDDARRPGRNLRRRGVCRTTVKSYPQVIKTLPEHLNLRIPL